MSEVDQMSHQDFAQGHPIILNMSEITKQFPGVIALQGVTFDVRAGEVHCLLGENGAGKSTLMKIMSGIYADYGGQVWLNGALVQFHNPREAQFQGIAMIHQELNLVPELTVYENIFLGREYKSRLGVIDRRKMRQEAQQLVIQLGLDIEVNQPIYQLRVGQRQLVEIAKALSLNARILIMDEPTSALSDTEVEYLFGVIRGLRAHDVAVIYISHRLDEIFAIADRITVLRDGKGIDTVLAKDVSRTELIKMMVGRELSVMYPKANITLGDIVLAVESLSYKQGRRHILKDISLNVRKGEIVGVAGLMGSGRTQLLEAIFGVYPRHAVSGRIWLDAKEVRFSSPKAAIENGIGLVAEDRKGQSLILERSVTENASLAALQEFMNWLQMVNRRREREAVKQVVQNLNIRTPTIDSLVGNLSGGNQQKVVIGKFLLSEIKLFLLDEPTRGIDVGAKAEIYQLVSQLAKNGTGFLLVSSEMPELLAVCDRIYVLCEGRLTGEFTRSEFNQEAIMDAATRFIDKAADQGAIGANRMRT
jgi:ribose transport system ATP-binding protein